MAVEFPAWNQRSTPGFVERWRADFGGSDSLTPTAYIDNENAYPFIVAAAWLFCPETFDYRGGVFLAEARRDTIDHWMAYFSGDIRRTESMVNQTHMFDVFTNVDVDSYGESNVLQLAYALGECWQGILLRRYPDRDIAVTVTDDADGAYGPTVTFAQRAH